jgi:ribosomal protein L16 Arg81 hydroxylase
VDALVGTREGGMTDRGLNVLASSPDAVVPAHFDMHHNFLLQIDGTKEVMIGSFRDRRVNERAIDRFYDEGNNNARALPDVATAFRLGPGDGVYIPPFAFHWVRGGPETSITISVGFRTRATEQANLVQECNARLRRFGLHPEPPGTSEHRDRAKVELLALARRARRASAPAVTKVRAGVRRVRPRRS